MSVWLFALTLVIPRGLDLYMPVPGDNPITEAKIALGRRLFHDRRLSRDQSVACTSCHDPKHAFASPQPRAVGVFGRTGRRNAPALINRGYERTFFWDGRATSLEEQALQPIQDHNEMDLTLGEASARVGLPPEEMSRALATYVRSILSGNSPFDQYMNGDRQALTHNEQAGLRIFRGKGNCTACHVGPTFSDGQFHNTGVAWDDDRYLDDGHFIVTANETDRGAFKTPTLREVARTGPYMHDGSFATLEAVVEFYDGGGRPNPNLDTELRPLRLTAHERQQLVAFLEALSGQLRDGA